MRLNRLILVGSGRSVLQPGEMINLRMRLRLRTRSSRRRPNDRRLRTMQMWALAMGEMPVRRLMQNRSAVHIQRLKLTTETFFVLLLIQGPRRSDIALTRLRPRLAAMIGWDLMMILNLRPIGELTFVYHLHIAILPRFTLEAPPVLPLQSPRGTN